MKRICAWIVLMVLVTAIGSVMMLSCADGCVDGNCSIQYSDGSTDTDSDASTDSGINGDS